jgi:transposase
LAPYLNTNSVNAFFREFEKEISSDVHVIMIWDRAGFHTADSVRVPESVSIINLPPYSPQLNPIEKLWQYLRKHFWSNRVYADYDALRRAAIEAWQNTCLDKGKVKSICRANYVESEFI